jgi:hypothetical protein
MEDDNNTPIQNIDDIIDAIGEVTRGNVHATRDRPYDGQPHTDQGERGRQIVTGLTMRDICDCFIMAYLESSGQPELVDLVEHGTWMYNDVYAVRDVDPIAVAQNLTCNVEKMMGIYPNIPMPKHEP